jgi:hypothetical protein
LQEATQLMLADIGQLFTEVMPDLRDQRVIFSQLGESIRKCQSAESQAWSTTLLSNGFRLNVGNVEAMSVHLAHFDIDAARELGMDREHTLVTLRLLLSAAESPLSNEQLGEEGSIDPINYASVGPTSWCYTGLFVTSSAGCADPSRAAAESHLQLLTPAHQAFIGRACRTPTGKVRQRSNYAQHHCQALHDYAKALSTG